MFTTPLAEDDDFRSSKRSWRSKRTLGAAALAAGLFLAACGSSDDAATHAAEDTPAAASDADQTVSISTGSTDVGDVLVDDAGLSLYGFLPDEGGIATCGGGCAQAWPPIMLPSGELPAGLDASIFSVTDAADGGSQLVAGGWPLYLFAGDAAPGDVTGQGSGGNWFLVAPDGSLITDEAAAATPAADAGTDDGYDY